MENRMPLMVDQELLRVIMLGIDELPIKIGEKSKAEIIHQVQEYNKKLTEQASQEG